MDDRAAVVDGPVSREVMRAGDADRERVVEQLRQAHGDGRLDLGEFDERARQAWAARTYGELAVVTADLPAAPQPPVRGVRSPARPAPRRGAVAGWLAASLINLLIWAIVSVATVEWIYPWWVWVAGPWGAMLLIGWISARVGGQAHRG
ncbi:MAG: DUF1707 SHOCT-like domain-containing protein [Pseudonocardiaceae bacterium]